MGKPQIRVPGHGTVVAYIALFVALGGTAFAVATVTGGDVVDGSLTSKDVKDRSLRAKDIKRGLPAGAPGAPGAPGADGQNGVNGQDGAPGTPGTPGSAKGYAFVEADGDVVASRSSGVVSVADAAAGVYCIDLSFAPKLAVASAFSNNNATATTSLVGDGGTGVSTCTSTFPTTDVVVVTRGSNDSTSTPVAVTFSVIFE